MVNLMKDIYRLTRRIGELTDKQACIVNTEWNDDICSFIISIQPNVGLYKSGKFDFKITLLNNFPKKPPLVWCLTDIYHPNIDTSQYCEYMNNVCMDILDTWEPSFGLEGVVLGLLLLFYYPNLEDPLSPYFDSDSINPELFKENVKHYMAGQAIHDGTVFNSNFKVVGDDYVINLCEDISTQSKIDHTEPSSVFDKTISENTIPSDTKELRKNTTRLNTVNVDGQVVLLNMLTWCNKGNEENEERLILMIMLLLIMALFAMDIIFECN